MWLSLTKPYITCEVMTPPLLKHMPLSSLIQVCMYECMYVYMYVRRRKFSTGWKSKKWPGAGGVLMPWSALHMPWGGMPGIEHPNDGLCMLCYFPLLVSQPNLYMEYNLCMCLWVNIYTTIDMIMCYIYICW